MPDVRIAVGQESLRCYLARPGGDGPWPGVVVLHDALGMTPDLRAQADWLAGEGYLALAPDLYSAGRKARCLVAHDPRPGRRAAAPRSPARTRAGTGWPPRTTAPGALA